MDETIRAAFNDVATIAVVGPSDKSHRASYRIASYFQQQGFRIIPVNPNLTTVLGERAYPDLESVPFPIDFVNIFRRSEYVGPIVDAAIRKGGIRTIWMQMGVYDRVAALRAEAAGIVVVMNRCAMVDHNRIGAGVRG